MLLEAGFRLEPVPWFRGAWILRSRDLRDLQQTSCYRENRIYVQGLSSLLTAKLLEAKPDEKILDMAAAPGSKTTQIVWATEDGADLTANEANRPRMYKLKANLERQGARHVRILLGRGEALGRRFPDTYDRVLVDAPCSCEARFRLDDPESLAYWKPAKVKAMAVKQKGLLLAGLKALRPGGRLVYATCTFSPEENEGVVDWALTRMEGRAVLQNVKIPVPFVPGLRFWQKRVYDESLSLTVRVLPDELMEGFFIAVLTKTGGEA